MTPDPVRHPRPALLAHGLPALAAIAAAMAAVVAAVAGPARLDIVVMALAVGLLAALWWRERAGHRAERGRHAQLEAERERLSDRAWELQEGEERYLSLIDAQGDLVVRRDPEHRVTFVNRAFAETFGLDPAAVVGGELDIGPTPSRPVREVRARDIVLETAAGRQWFSWSDIPVRDGSGRLGAVYSVARNIDGRKKNEQALDDARLKAEAASHAKSQLLATVSHEFRTPLNGILGLTTLMRESGLPNEQQAYARGVEQSGETLLALVDDMLDFSSIEAGRLELRDAPTEIEPLVRDLVELLAVRAEHKGVDIVADVDPRIPPVSVDAVRLRQILTNLAGNGIKFTDAGGVVVGVALASEADAGVRLAFTVTDTGPGIAAADAERLFGEFEQSEAAASRRHGGAGLGLAISRRLVRAMGSDLVLTDRDTSGATFAFTLDLPRAGSPQVADAAALAGTRVLIVGTGLEITHAARKLGRAGADARVVGNARDAGGLLAAALAAGQPYHAVLVDDRVGEAPAAALAELRQAAGTRLAAAVVVGAGGRGDVAALRQGGFDAYLVRPLRAGSLARVVGGLRDADKGFLDDPRDPPSRRSSPVPPPTRSMDVLMAEDNDINALLTRAVLERLGHTVTEVGNGEAAVAAVKDRGRPFDAIVMDLHMPGRDGLSAAREIRALEAAAGAAPVPILAVSADVIPETAEAAMAAGVNAVLAKPLKPSALRGALAKVCLPGEKGGGDIETPPNYATGSLSGPLTAHG